MSKDLSFSLRNGEEVAWVVAVPRCCQCSQRCLLCRCRGFLGQWCVQPPPFSLPSFPPSLSRAHTSSNSPLLNLGSLTQAFIGAVAADCMALWPTGCCRTHGGCPRASALASQMLTPLHLHQLTVEMLLVAEECEDLPALGPVPGFKKGVCCTGYRLFFIRLSPPS